MAEHTHTTYSCDRCKADLGSERPNRSMRTNVVARFDYTEGPGPAFQWVDLCDSCDEAVKAFFIPREGLTGLSASERRDNREWMRRVVEAANTDLSDYMIRRLRKMSGKTAFDEKES